MKKMRAGVIGLGRRGTNLTNHIVAELDKVEITALCDSYEDRVDAAEELIRNRAAAKVLKTTDAMEVIKSDNVDILFIFAAWEAHMPLTIAAMKAGKPVAVEVGGAYSVEQCWDLVKTYEETKTPVYLLENCCFGKRELMILNIVQKGIFGKIVHCDGGYCHELRDEILNGIKNRHYRLRNYINRNCENYPTHELGPIAQILKINRGNKFLTLSSFASKAEGLKAYVKEHMSDDEMLMNTDFAQGDVVTTVIKCAGGETIRLSLDTTLPRFYSRDFTVRGTKGMYEERSDSIFLDGNETHAQRKEEWKKEWGNAENYRKDYEHPIWQKYIEDGIKVDSHDGMDWLVINDFVNCIAENRPCTIDVYDMASWMSITPLSEQSIAMGGRPVAIPDFTNGAWTRR